MSKRLCTRCGRYYPATVRDCPACGPPWWRRPIRLPWRSARESSPSSSRLERPGVLIAAAAVTLLAIYRINTTGAERARRAADEQAAAAQRAAQAAQREAAACRQSAKCWGEKHSASATVTCMRRTDRAARYATRWPSGLFNPAFLNWEWRDQKAGTLVYIGRVELQNGFGAWAPYIVGCLYDPATRTALDIELKPGRL